MNLFLYDITALSIILIFVSLTIVGVFINRGRRKKKKKLLLSKSVQVATTRKLRGSPRRHK